MSDPHRFNPDPHYRIYQKHGATAPTVICLQDFDYPNYTNGIFVSADAWNTEEEALRTLEFFFNIDKMTDGQHILWESIDRWFSEISEIYPELNKIDKNIWTEIASYLVLEFD